MSDKENDVLLEIKDLKKHFAPHQSLTQTLAGTVRAASRPGKGTVFTVIFPFKK